MVCLRDELIKMAEPSYADFQRRIVPNIPKESILGIRVPLLRKIAQEFSKKDECEIFLRQLPHKYYEENMIHALLLEKWKDEATLFQQIDAFLPYVNNWAVCDTIRPKILKKNKEKLFESIKGWIKSKEPFTVRFGLEMLMLFFLEDNDSVSYLAYPLKVSNEDYYVQMMIAWFYATALAKRWEDTIHYLEDGKLPLWIHNKAIQKACESFCLPDQRKEYLRLLRKKTN